MGMTVLVLGLDLGLTVMGRLLMRSFRLVRLAEHWVARALALA